MSRSQHGVRYTIALLAFLTTACGSVKEPDPKPDLFDEYLRSSSVKNDRYPTPGALPDDRMTILFGKLSPEELINILTTPLPCASADSEEPGIDCRLTPEIRAAAWDETGSAEDLHKLSIIVKHSDDSLELVDLYLAGEGTSTVLIDRTGATYSGDVSEFLDDNEILEPDDIVLAPERITARSGGRLVTVYGQTEVAWLEWILAGTAVALVGGGLVVLLQERARRRDEVTPARPPGP